MILASVGSDMGASSKCAPVDQQTNPLSNSSRKSHYVQEMTPKGYLLDTEGEKSIFA